MGLLYFRRAKYVLEFWEPITHDEGFRLVVELGVRSGQTGRRRELQA
jgi:hypothetical protein